MTYRTAMRLPILDPVKALAAHVIVLHHLMLYSSMRGPLQTAFPDLIAFLSDPARYAVQVFLVISGFLTFQSLQRWAPLGNGSALSQGNARQVSPMTVRELFASLSARYRRLMRPFALAMVMAVIALAWVQGYDPVTELAPAVPEQLLAHLLLLHGVLGIDSLSAGVWYVAIDFQLFGLSLLCAFAANRASIGLRMRGVNLTAGALLLCMLSLLTVGGLLVFNLQAGADNWAPYFFGSYGLGMLACWAVQHKRRRIGLALSVGLIAVAQLIAYRERLWVSGATVFLLLAAPAVRELPRWMNTGLAGFLNRSSYALFLVHYPLSIVLFAVIESLFLESVAENLIALAICIPVFWLGARLLMAAEVAIFDWTPQRQPAFNGSTQNM